MSSSSFRSRALVAALFALASVPLAANAAAPAPSPAPSSSPTADPANALTEIGRVSTSDRRVERLGLTSRPTFVVDRAHIEAFGARTVSDALLGVPGVQSFAYGPFGAQADYGIRGAASEQTLVLVDGVPVTDPTTGTTFLGQLSTAGVDRIEIVESGSSTLYGTNAGGGVINVITRVPRGAYLEASAASFADRDVRVGVGDGRAGGSYERHVATNAYGYPALTYSRAACAGAFAAPGPCTFAGGVRTNDFGDQTVVRLNLDEPLSGGLRVRARADDAVAATGVPGRLDFLAPSATLTYATKSGVFEVERATPSQTLVATFGASQTRLAYVDPVNNNGESDVYTGRSQVSLRDAFSSARADAVAGVDLSRESGAFSFPAGFGVPAFGVGASRSLVAAYAQAGVAPLRGVRLTAGLRSEHDAPGGSVLAPSFGGTIRAGAVRFAGNIGESFRVPTLQDLYYPGFSNPALKPEKSSNVDATIALDGRAASVSVGYFGRSGSNFIVYDPVQNKPVNATRAQTAGLALTATTRPFGGLIAEANYTNLFRALDLSTGARLPRNPVGQASLALSRPFGGERYAFGVRWRIVGSDGDDAANLTGPASATYDAYDSLDAYVRLKVASGAILSVRGFDLGDTRYAPIFGYPAPGRRFAVEFATR